MKGCDFVKKAVSDKAKSHLLTYKRIFRIAGILLVLTIISTRMVCGLYAKYTFSDSTQESARIAAMAGIELKEASVYIISDIDEKITANSIYKFGNGTENGIEYEYVVPGVDIPKNPYVVTDGKNEVPCYLYIEVSKNNVPDTVTFEIREEWRKIENITGQNGGDVYFYKDIVKANEKKDKIEIVKNNKIYVSQNYTLKNNSENKFNIIFRGYMIQAAEGYTAEDLFKNHVKEGE